MSKLIEIYDYSYDSPYGEDNVFINVEQISYIKEIDDGIHYLIAMSNGSTFCIDKQSFNKIMEEKEWR